MNSIYNMKNCHYCDFKYESDTDFIKHLNEKHFRCVSCKRVFDIKDNKRDSALCDKCFAMGNSGKLSEQEFLSECLKFLTYFRVDYSQDTIRVDDGSLSVIMRQSDSDSYHDCFVGYSIYSVAEYVAKKLNKRFEYRHSMYDQMDDWENCDE